MYVSVKKRFTLVITILGCLAALFHLHADDIAPTQFESLPISAIEIIAPPSENSALLRSYIDIEPGYLLSSQDLSRVLRRLYGIGRFYDVRIKAERSAEGVALQFQFIAERLLRELIFKGDTQRSVQEDIQSAIGNRARLTSEFLNQLTQRCVKSWKKEGYFQAACDIQIQEAPKGDGYNATMTMKKGHPAKIGAVNFKGMLATQVIKLLNLTELHVGDHFNERTLKEDERKIRLAYLNRGFLQATLKSEGFYNAADNSVTLEHQIDAKERVQIEVRGHSVFKTGAILALLKRADDERLSRAMLDDWRKATTEHYQHAGFLNAQVELKQERDPRRHIVTYVLNIQEKSPLTLRKVSFPGASFFAARRLQEELFASVGLSFDLPILSGGSNPAATRSLLDGALEASKPSRFRAPPLHHPIFRDDGSQVYEPKLYEEALEIIRKLYIASGFKSAEVGPIQVITEPPGHTLRLEIPIKEGPRTLIESVTLHQNQLLKDIEIKNILKLAPAEPYSEFALEEAKAALTKAMHQKGHIYARITPRVSFVKEQTRAVIDIDIEDGPQVTIGKIFVQGNTRTLSSVAMGRLPFKTGSIYTPDKAFAAQNYLKDVEMFDSASVSLLEPEQSNETKDVVVQVNERKEFSVGVGAGLSTLSGVSGFVDFTHRNVARRALIFNASLKLNRQFMFVSPIYGQNVAEAMADRYAKFTILNQIERVIRLSLRTPRYIALPAKPLFSVDAVHERQNTINYSLDSVQMLLSSDLSVAKPVNLLIETSLNFNRLKCFPTISTTTAKSTDAQGNGGANTNLECKVLDQVGDNRSIDEGDFLIAKISPSLILDFRDDRFNPHKGFWSAIKVDTAGGVRLGDKSRFSFLKLEVKTAGYIPLHKDVTLALALRAGNIFSLYEDKDSAGQSKNVLLTQRNERFYMGGYDSLRGMPSQALIPQDFCIDPQKCSNPGEYFNYASAGNNPGGAFYALLKAELRFRILSAIYGSVFTDIGNLYFSAARFNPIDLRVNVGFGLRVKTPVGSIAIDWGFNVRPRSTPKEEIVTFPFLYFGLF